MSAVFKSHILSRDEKGFAGIPFKRLLLSGVSGGLAYTLIRLALPDLAPVVGIGIALAALILTGTRGGVPLWLRLWIRLRGSLLIGAAQEPTGLRAQIALLLNVPLPLARLNGEALFAAPVRESDIDLREWTTFLHSGDVTRGDGLVFVESPLAGDASSEDASSEDGS